MITIKIFQFNAFQENTYLLYDATGECIIIDPGMSNEKEKNEIINFISNNNLKPISVVNTHSHIDHILGIAFLTSKYNIDYYMHKSESEMFNSSAMVGMSFGMKFDKPEKLPKFLDEGNEVKFGKSILQIFYVPGHSSGSLCFYSKEDNFLISGDVLFSNSIGRSDLPGGDHNTLIRGIKSKLFTLPDECKVYPGHGSETTIGDEKKFNPFLK